MLNQSQRFNACLHHGPGHEYCLNTSDTFSYITRHQLITCVTCTVTCVCFTHSGAILWLNTNTPNETNRQSLRQIIHPLFVTTLSLLALI